MIYGARFLLAVLLLAGAACSADADEPFAYDLRALWVEARQGDADASYRLGQYYKSRYWLAERDPNIRGNPDDLVFAFALFRIAEKSNSLDALYGRNETEYQLKQVLGVEELEAALDMLPEWMTVQGPPPSWDREVVSPEPDYLEPDNPEPDNPATAEPSTTQAPPETQLALVDLSAEPMPEAAPDPEPDLQLQSETDAARPDLETLLARGTSFLAAGDPVAARGFFKLAARQGSGEAAMLVAMTYDPEYLEPLGVVGLRPDAERAATWYLKAIEMGNKEAESRVHALNQWIDQRAP